MKVMNSVSNCIADIKQWLSQNFLYLNEDKTECIVFGTSCMPNVEKSSFDPLASHFKPAVKNVRI